ncbi:MAG: homoserine dehydrogenase, partial [Chitinispirillia bacterium]
MVYNIGLAGAGTVGGGFIKIFVKQKTFFNKSLGLNIELKRIVDKNTSLFKSLPINGAVCTDNIDDIIDDPDIHIVIELIGGTAISRTLILRALNNGKHVVTANKALLAEYGPEIFETAEANNVSVFFEASVGGGTPVIKTIREALIGNDIISVNTIINGTCNYILTQMAERGYDFESVLKKSQEAGYAEADPTLDISGGDTGHKIAIMASLLFGGYVPFKNIYIEGIQDIDALDIHFAKNLGYTIKLLGIIKKNQNAGLDIRVHPAMLHANHILSSVSD